MPQTPVTYVDGPTIEAGESLSDGVQVSAGRVVRITLPGPEEWTQADLTFQVSTDGVYYNDVFDDEGNEIVIPGAPHWATIVLSGRVNLDTIGWLKIRSGTRDTPVEQPATCKMALTLQTYT
jgi:hypothetical protein